MDKKLKTFEEFYGGDRDDIKYTELDAADAAQEEAQEEVQEDDDLPMDTEVEDEFSDSVDNLIDRFGLSKVANYIANYTR
jgi:hypothetical protein